MKPHTLSLRVLPFHFLLVLSLFGVGQAGRAGNSGTASSKERELLQVLQSTASPDKKAITCKQLAIYGGKESVPSLAGLLRDKELASWARIALEAIPDPAAVKALRDNIPKLQGRLLIGVINSLGARRDAKSITLLTARLNDPDAGVACAAAESLGRIGGSQAARSLKSRVAKSTGELRSAAAEGCIRGAERFLAEGKRSQAVKLYDYVRGTEVPRERLLEATRGSILARGKDGIPLLLEQLRSPDKALLAIGLHTARELPGTQVTRALAEEMRRSPANRQPLLLLALAEREDPTALPALLSAAREGSKELRLVAVNVLDRAGDPSALEVLLELAASSDSALRQAARNALGRLPGGKVDEEILTRLSQSDAASRPVLFDVAGRRGMESALPVMLESATSPEPSTRGAALSALGTIGGDREAAALVKLLQTQQKTETRADLEAALLAISSRRGAACAPIVLPLAQSNDPETRRIALRALAATGGPASLQAVQDATQDKDEQVSDEAVQTLSSWPNTWPEDSQAADALLALAKSAQKPSHQVLALRGLLQFLLGDEKLKPDEKLRRVNETLPLLNRPEDKRLAIAVVRKIHKADALDLLVNFAGETAIADDACSAIIDVAGQPKSELSRPARQQALQTALEKSANDSLKQKAQAALDKLN